jgi:hypothetical protein
MPYGYYQFVRFVAMVGFAVLAYFSYQQKRETEIIVFIALAVLFQPLIKIALGRTLWNIVDVFVAIGLITTMFISSKNKDSLEQRLKKLDADMRKKIILGAMCYSMVEPSIADYKCPSCGHKTGHDNYTIWNIEHIRTIVVQIKNAGYDVVLDEHEFCKKCSTGDKLHEIKVQYPELIFKIRYNPDSPYHIAKSNIVNDYNCILEFLKGNDFYSGKRDEIMPLHWNIDILQKMLGIGKEIIPPKLQDEDEW